MHTVSYEVFFILTKNYLCYKVFEHNYIIETTAAHFFKKKMVKLEMFFEHKINLKVKEI